MGRGGPDSSGQGGGLPLSLKVTMETNKGDRAELLLPGSLETTTKAVARVCRHVHWQRAEGCHLSPRGTGPWAPTTVEHVLDASVLLMGRASGGRCQTVDVLKVRGVKLLHTDKPWTQLPRRLFRLANVL